MNSNETRWKIFVLKKPTNIKKILSTFDMEYNIVKTVIYNSIRKAKH